MSSVKILKNYIDGQFVETKMTFDDINPVDGSLVAHVCEADKELVDRAVLAAKRALKGEWGSYSVTQRAKLLHNVANEIERRFDDFVTAEIADTGKAYDQVKNIDIPRGAANFRFFADLVQNQDEKIFEMTTADGCGATNQIVNKPLGVVAVISPWNLPLLLMTWKVSPALACGNTQGRKLGVVDDDDNANPGNILQYQRVMGRCGRRWRRRRRTSERQLRYQSAISEGMSKLGT